MNTVIFDFDGTLANTLPICFYAFQRVFKEFDNKDFSTEEIKAMFGPSETEIIKENLSHENKKQAIGLYYTTYLENHSKLVDYNKEIDELLRYLKNKGIKLGIVTGKAKRSLDISLGELQMDNFFDVIITGDDVNKPKPDPEGLIKALSVLGVKSTEAMFIGDSDADIQAGLQAKVYTIGVQWLPDYQTMEFTNEPDAVFDSVTDFMKSVKAGGLYES
ncbi:HAD family hydrolase [Virgibacillus sp. NKC19-16]|uniref:HAD family hydrolase n=1 Tax=Virgibacillus salidurans TaxID=2831673 RepID=UPI001F1CD096|nr:HAD family hydrolase [Virgibacillus sp. NKC19-16]UJL48184.1 HAD family hydrolase [Virgibacillus sp. NKC19-16]